MDGTPDIFATLDTSLLEIFQRGQLVDHLRNLPPEEQARRLQELSRALRDNQPHTFDSITTTEVKYFYFIWLWKIPLLVVNFTQIWRDMTVANVLDFTFDTITKVIMFTLRVVRFTVFMVTSFIYFHRIIRIFFVFCDVMTFSNHFMRDAFTYIFQNSLEMLKRHEIIMKNDGNVLYFLQYTNSTEMSSFNVLHAAIYNTLSATLVTTCMNKDGKVSCRLDTDSLIFKLSDVITTHYPSLNSSTGSILLKILTILLYMTYAIIGDIICINIWFFCMYNFLDRAVKYKQMFINLRGIIWKSLVRYLI
ncbi:uncharacterized protein SPAPADRAFT_142568 [Spathaspora passalidarum NRRL Y-27907]|uniref:Uncharacterized protein n=1 Tax=Spathaspora passalidarum (strain NRRL Y-27907 / 11-Y1) TaxID=619300 RepID=G3AS66_SPAPN|nr:uncharacterized protein SPAPADRAFT_142568 [Spathaspora passalidarum NRRL Y-27907]EGW31025.1 hypothetical protein SPAPADRAFT_142568 [Spathaspora passalidarum NRRL Y-27907]